ncbi:MAG: peptidoglycan-binding protein [Patescibacteria group bacterium]
MNKKFYIILILLCVSGWGTRTAFASPVTFSSDTTLALSSPAINLTAVAGSVADQIVVNAGTLVVSMSNTTGGTFVFTSPRAMSVGTSGSGGTVQQTCSGGIETVTITQLSSSEVFTFTPTGSACSGTPDAPTIGVATAGNAQATVTYTAPVSNGGSSILYYMAVSSPGNIMSATTSATSVVVTGLTNGTPYTFTVTATNANGTSTPSSSSNSISPTDGIPILSSISSGSPGATSATITWVTDLASNSQVEYGLSSVYTASSTLDSTLTTSHSVVLSGLSQATTYHYRVMSSNGVATTSVDYTFTTTTQSSGGSSGGGGGGGGGGSYVAPNVNISNFKSSSLNSGVYLTWTNPTDPSFLKTVIMRKLGSFSTSTTDGVSIFEGTAGFYIDSNLVNGVTYYYTAFSVTPSGVNTAVRSTIQGTPLGNSLTPSVPITTPTIPPVSNPVGTTGSGSNASLLPRVLSLSLSGDDVVWLQKFLITNGYLASGYATGYFGSLTEKAVQKFQSAVGILSQGSSRTNGYGIVGIKTRLAILARVTGSSGTQTTPQTTPQATNQFTRNLSLYMKGNDVKLLQIFLQSKGYLPSTLVPTTLFGNMTYSALVKYQKDMGISPASGYFGPLTRKVVNQ